MNICLLQVLISQLYLLYRTLCVFTFVLVSVNTRLSLITIKPFCRWRSFFKLSILDAYFAWGERWPSAFSSLWGVAGKKRFECTPHISMPAFKYAHCQMRMPIGLIIIIKIIIMNQTSISIEWLFIWKFTLKIFYKV